MIYLLLVWGIQLSLLLGYGTALDTWLKLGNSPHVGRSLLLGLIALGLLSSAYCLFLPLDGLYLSLQWAIGLGLLLLFREKVLASLRSLYQSAKTAPKALVATMLLVLVIALLKSTSPTEIGDDGMAYGQQFRQLMDFGTLPGFGNLKPNFSYNSLWHTLAVALGTQQWWEQMHSFDINGLLVLILCIYTLAYWEHSQSIGSKVLLAFWPLFLFRNQLTAPSTDVVAFILAIIVIFEASSFFHTEQRNLGFLWLMATFAFLVKVTCVAFLPLVSWLTWLAFKRSKQIPWLAIAFSAVLIGLWLARNVLLTGYLYFMVPSIDLFVVDWKIPVWLIELMKVQVQNSLEHSHSYNFAWLQVYLRSIPTNQFVLLTASVASLLTYLAASFIRPKSVEARYLSIALTLLGGVLFWWLSGAREFRYGVQYLLPGLLFLLPATISMLWPKIHKVNLNNLLALASLMALLPSLIKTSKESQTYLAEGFMLPMNYPEPTFETRTCGHVNILFARSYAPSQAVAFKRLAPEVLPFDWRFPATIVEKYPMYRLEPRGKDISHGWRIAKEQKPIRWRDYYPMDPWIDSVKGPVPLSF